MLGLFKKKEFMEWQDYQHRIETIDNIIWSQRVRRKNLQNI
ncbi:MAG: hypothetical protein U9R34_05070 [Nanoarchaeota archaeon]|nr:hypothetical protein [Nanoarchaeota archaeon]